MEKLLPQSIDSEQGVLGSIILDPDAIVLVADLLEPRDFYRDAHKALYEVIVELYRRSDPADFLTICDELSRRGKLEDVGDAGYITSLINCVPTSGNVEYYARIVKAASRDRQLIHAAGLIAANAYERDPEALTKAEQMVFQIGKQTMRTDFFGGDQVASNVMETLEKLHKRRGSLVGVPTGFYSLDHLTGGLQRSDLIILAARPGMGKTSLALALAYAANVRYSKRVAFFSLEMSKDQLMQRLIAMDSGINGQRIRNGTIEDDEWQSVVNAADRVGTDLFQIDDTGGISMMDMRSKARRLQAEKGVDLIIVDYLQLMQARENGKRVEPRLQELQEISGGLKALAKELDVPVVALAQLSRAVEGRTVKIPQLSDLRESGSIENDADIVMFIYREDYYADIDPGTGLTTSSRPNIADLIIAKHRNGPVGEINLYWADAQTRFFNDEEEYRKAYAQE